MKVTGSFTLPVSTSWSQSQTKTVRLDCDTTAEAVSVTLPAIEDVLAVNGGDVEIIISDTRGNASVNQIRINVADDVEDTIEGEPTISITANKHSLILKIGTDGIWNAF